MSQYQRHRRSRGLPDGATQDLATRRVADVGLDPKRRGAGIGIVLQFELRGTPIISKGLFGVPYVLINNAG